MANTAMHNLAVCRHFAQEHMGKYVGLTLAASAFLSSFQFILRFYLFHHHLLVSVCVCVCMRVFVCV